MSKLIFGTILGAVVLYIWMTISWVVIPWHCATFNQFSHEESVASVMMSNTTKDGIYILPNCHGSSDKEKAEAAWKKGPVLFMSIQRNGQDFTSPKPYVIGFITYLIGAFLVTLMVLQTKIANYKNRLGFITLFGIAAGVLAVLPDWNWWGFSSNYTLVSFLDYVIGWFLAGIIIAAIAKPKTIDQTR